jgi:hypothetical protein
MIRHGRVIRAAAGTVAEPLTRSELMTPVHALFRRKAIAELPRTAETWAPFFGLGAQSLSKWRQAVRRHNATFARPAADGNPLSDLLREGSESWGAVLSPFLEVRDLGPPLGTTFVARRPIEAGMFLISLPVASMILAQTPPVQHPAGAQKGSSSDDARESIESTRFVADVEDLATQLLWALSDPSDNHHAYAMFLRQVPAPPNLPYMKPWQFKSMEGAEMHMLFEHEFKTDRPLCPGLHGVSEMEKRWAIAHVLSRRVGKRALCPVVDLLNHHVSPNAHYTAMTFDSTPATADREDASHTGEASQLTALDVLDNVMAGVEDDALLEPHLHVFSLVRIAAGAPITLSYSAADPHAAEGQDMWMLQWGFVPPAPSELSSKALDEAVSVISQHRLHRRRELFPE